MGVQYTQKGDGKYINQDGAVAYKNIAACFDGCSACEHAEKGVERICNYLRNEADKINSENFEAIIYRFLYEDILQNSKNERCETELFYTILVCVECENEFVVFTAGDGYIITVGNENKVQYCELKNDLSMMNGEAPGYLYYNYWPIEHGYNTNITFKRWRFPKSLYKKVYVASDGVRFILLKRFPEEERARFNKALAIADEDTIIEILKNDSGYIKDDISIATQ